MSSRRRRGRGDGAGGRPRRSVPRPATRLRPRPDQRGWAVAQAGGGRQPSEQRHRPGGAIIRHTAGGIAATIGVIVLPAVPPCSRPPWAARIGRFTLLDAARQVTALHPAPQAPSAPDPSRCSIWPGINAEHPASAEKKVPYRVPDHPRKPLFPRYPAEPPQQDPPAHHDAAGLGVGEPSAELAHQESRAANDEPGAPCATRKASSVGYAQA